MKKIVSIITVLTMLCTMLAIPAFAASSVAKTYLDNTTGATINNGTATAEVSGIGGKIADDIVTYTSRIRPQSEIDSGNTGNHKFQYLASTGTADAGYGDLMVFDFEFFINANIRNVLLTGDGGVNISTVYNLQGNEKVLDGWNRLVYVYDHSTAGVEKGEQAGAWAMYLNGECLNVLGENRVEMTQTRPNTTNTYVGKGKMSQMRVMFNAADASKETSMYFDNPKIYAVTTDDKADFMAQFVQDKPVVAASDKYTAAEGIITTVAGAVAGDIEVADGTNVRIYADSQYGKQLSPTDTLKSSNVVVLEKDGIYNYYKIEGADGTKILYEAYQSSDVATFHRGVKGDSTGIGGKTAADNAILLNTNVVEHPTSQTNYNGFFSYAPGKIADGVWSNIDTSGYLVIEGEVFPDSIQYVTFSTNGGSKFADIVCPSKEWTKFYVVYDFTNKKIKVVCDGAVTIDWADTVYGQANRNDIRFHIVGGANEALAQVYLDDYKVYTTKIEPEYAVPVALDSTKYTITDGYLVADEADTVADITAEGATVRAYSDNAYTDVLANDAVLLKNNVVVVEADNGCFSYYPVQSALSRLPVVVITDNSDSDTLTKPTGGRCSLAVADGFGGKAASDKVGKVTETQQENDFFFQVNVPTTTSVITASILVYPHEAVTGYAFATNGHAGIGSAIPADKLVADKWNRITVKYDPATKYAKTYLNDELFNEGETSTLGSVLRILFKTKSVGDRDADERIETYYDDFMIFAGPMAMPVADFGDYTLNAWGINGYGEDTVSQALAQITAPEGFDDYTVKIFDETGAEADASDKIEKGYTVYVCDGDIRLGTYMFDISDFEVAGDAVLITDAYDSANGKFGAGNLNLFWDVNVYDGSKDIYGIIAQYDANKNLIDVSMEKNTITGKGTVTATLENCDGTGSVKCMLWDAATLAPLAGSKVYSAYSADKIEAAIPLYEGFTTKSAVFNYDDGIASDAQLVELLDKYEAKATFNLVSGRLYNNMKSAAVKAGYSDSEEDVYAFAKAMYAGKYGNHEISTHTVAHKPAHLDPGEESADSKGNKLVGASTEDEIADIQNCPIQVREWFGLEDDEVIGLAWPNGNGHSRSDYYTDLEPAMVEVGLKYARHDANGTFELPEDWFSWHATAHHPNAAPYVDSFIALPNSGDMKCLFIWGHTYEFNDNINDDNLNWNYIERIVKALHDQGNIWFATNGDVYRYVEATKLVEVTDTTVTNNSDMTVYYNINGKNVELAAGDVYTIGQ